MTGGRRRTAGERQEIPVRRESALPDVVWRAVRALIEAARPGCVVLFGSYARGQARADSDLDLIFVVPGRSSRDVAVQLRKIWRAMQRQEPRLPSVDLLVYTPEEFRQNFVVGFVPYEALREGVVVYGEPPVVGEPMVGKGR